MGLLVFNCPLLRSLFEEVIIRLPLGIVWLRRRKRKKGRDMVASVRFVEGTLALVFEKTPSEPV